MSLAKEIQKSLGSGGASGARIQGDQVDYMHPMGFHSDWPENEANAAFISVSFRPSIQQKTLDKMRELGKALFEREIPADLGKLHTFSVRRHSDTGTPFLYADFLAAAGLKPGDEKYNAFMSHVFGLYNRVVKGDLGQPPTRTQQMTQRVRGAIGAAVSHFKS